MVITVMKRAPRALLVGCLLAASSATALAQQVNPSQLTPAGARATPGGSQPTLGSVGGNLETPRGADKKFFQVKRVVVEGSFPELRQETDALIAQIGGRRASVAEAYAFARAVQEAYNTAHFPLAKVGLDARSLDSGVIRLTVIDGFIESLDLSKAPERYRALIESRLQPLIGKRHVTLEEIQRRLLLVGHLAGLSSNSINRPGTQPGSVVIALSGEDHLLQGATSTDNRLSKYLGTWEFSQSGRINNAFGFGEQFFGGVSTTRDLEALVDGQAKFQFFGGGVMLPLGSDGLTATAGYNQVRLHPTPLPFTFNFPFDHVEHESSLYERAYARLNYPLILTLDSELRLQASYEHIQQRYRDDPLPYAFDLSNTPLFDVSRDRFDVVRFAADWGFFLPWQGGKAVFTPEFTQGLGGRFPDAQSVYGVFLGGVPGTRPDAGPMFSKLSVYLRAFQTLPEDFKLGVFLRAQTSFGRPLPLAEQFSLDVTDVAVSGFAAGTLNTDKGATLRSELSKQLPAADFDFASASASPYIFGAVGRGATESQYAGEFRNTDVESIGGGLRMDTRLHNSPFVHSFSVECAKDFYNNWMYPSGYRTNFSFATKF